MGWVYFHNTGEFLGDLPEGDTIPLTTPNREQAIKDKQRREIIRMVEKSFPGSLAVKDGTEQPT